MPTSTHATISCAVIGASGYTGEELVKILSAHPRVELTALTSRQLAGQRVADCFGLFNRPDLPAFENLEAQDVRDRAEVFFLALPHGVASGFAVPLREAGKTVIDLSADFRLRDPDLYQSTYGKPHPAPALLSEAVYGLVEWQYEALPGAGLIACPGCYPTSVQLPLIPLLKAGLVSEGDIIVASYSGISGAGKKAETYYSYSERAESITAYGLPRHRHVPEMEQELSAHAGYAVRLRFAPHLAPLIRGMHSTISIPVAAGVDDLHACLEAAYRDRPFVHVLPPGGDYPDTRRTRGGNHACLSVKADYRDGRAWLLSTIDNLGKGAAGQAVQAFNICRGLPETAGLEHHS